MEILLKLQNQTIKRIKKLAYDERIRKPSRRFIFFGQAIQTADETGLFLHDKIISELNTLHTRLIEAARQIKILQDNEELNR